MILPLLDFLPLYFLAEAHADELAEGAAELVAMEPPGGAVVGEPVRGLIYEYDVSPSGADLFSPRDGIEG